MKFYSKIKFTVQYIIHIYQYFTVAKIKIVLAIYQNHKNNMIMKNVLGINAITNIYLKPNY